MKPSSIVTALGVCLAAGSFGTQSGSAGAAPALTAPTTSVSRLTSAAVTDTTVLARVNDRLIRVGDFRDRYFNSEAVSRPGSDSTGRLQFLNTMINKEVLSLTAVTRNRALSFEDRMRLTQISNSALATVFYDREVTDRIVVTEKDLLAIHPQLGVELKLSNLTFPDRKLAERVRDDLAHKRITWREALKRYANASDAVADGDLGWFHRERLDPVSALEVFKLRPPAISGVISGATGYTIWRCIDQRPLPLPPFQGVRRMLLLQLREVRAVPLSEAFFAHIRERAGVHYDTTNVVWLAGLFEAANPPATDHTVIDLRSRIPRVAPADTGRVLATTRRGRFTVDQFLTTYRSVPSFIRTKVSNGGTLLNILQRMVLEPDIVEVARERGIERDPEYAAFVEQRREGMLVEALYDDSVVSRVRVTEPQRKRYYEEHRDEYVSRELVRYAIIQRGTEAAADSVIARIRAGERPEAIVRADSISGWWRSRIRQLHRGEAYDYTVVLFEEMKPGETSKFGPTRSLVLHVFSHDFPRPMSYNEVLPIVDESLQNIEAERQLDAFVARASKQYRVESRPELLMKFALTDPMGEWEVQSGD